MKKKCSKCGVEYLATTEFFHKKGNSLTSDCKKCRRCESNTKRLSFNCNNCGNNFVPKFLDRTTYCSRGCSYEASNKKKKEREEILKEEKKNKSIKTCLACNKEFQTKKDQKFCSTECREATNKNKRIDKYVSNLNKNYKCKVCNKKFKSEYKNMKRSFCCEECEIEYKRIKKRAFRKTTKGKEEKHNWNTKRRLKNKSQFVEKVNRKEIYERDKWICQLCGCKVDKRIKYPHIMSASLDHIIPIAEGGTHESKNCQLAHFICNSKKSNRALNEQLRLC
jgi:predicted nucleic acid-binding Zn ribbon protein